MRSKYSILLAFLLLACLPLASQNRSAVVFKDQIDGDLNTLTHSYPGNAPRAFADLRTKLAGQNQRSPMRFALFPPQVICGYSVGHERETARIMYRFLSDSKPEVRRESIMTFSCFQPAYRLPLSFLLSRLSHDKSLLVREQAVSSIGQLGNLAERAVPELTAVASNTNEDAYLREDILRALAEIEDKSPNLIPLFENLMADDPERGVQWTALQALLERARSMPAARSAILSFIASARHGAAAEVQAEAINKSCSNINDHTDDASLADSLLVALRSDSAASNTAASCLSTMEPLSNRDSQQVISLLRDKDAGLRSRAALALSLRPHPSSWKPPRSLTPLDLRLTSPRPARNATSFYALSPTSTGLSTAAQGIYWKQILGMNMDEDGNVSFPGAKNRFIVTLTLNQDNPFSPARIVPIALRLLKDNRPDARVAAAFALGGVPNPSEDAISALITALNDPDPDVRTAAAKALGSYGVRAKSSGDALAQLLGRDPDARVRSVAVTSLCSVGASGRPELESLETALTNDSTESVRAAIPETLHCLDPNGDESFRAIMRAASDSSPSVRAAAFKILGAYGSRAALILPLLTERLTALLASKNNTIESPDTIAESIYNLALDARETHNTHALAPLRAAEAALEHDPNLQKRYSYGVEVSIQDLDLLVQSSAANRLNAWAEHHHWILVTVVALSVYIALLSIWAVLLWINAFWIHSIDMRLEPVYEFLPIKPDWSEIPFEYLIGIGWFRYADRVLDAWINRYREHYAREFNNLDTVSGRSLYFKIPVQIDDKSTEALSDDSIGSMMSPHRVRILIAGIGGVGKTAVACQIAQWTLATRRHRMVPILLQEDYDAYSHHEAPRQLARVAHDKLKAILGAQNDLRLSEGFVKRLLERGRVVVIADRVSELSDFTRDMIARCYNENYASRLILTSRDPTFLTDSSTTLIEPPLLRKGTLATFIQAYLEARNISPLSDAEFHKACSELVEIVGDHELTPFLAKLFVDRLIEVKARGNDHRRAESIIDLVLLYLEDTNGKLSNQDGEREDDANVLLVAKILAWECVKQRYSPGAGSVENAVKAIVCELNTHRDRALELFRYCEKRLNLIQGLGGPERFRFCLDPVAEHLAALYLFEKCRVGRSDDLELNLQTKTVAEGSVSSGFVAALLDCCRFRGSIADVPHAFRQLIGLPANGETERVERQVETVISPHDTRRSTAASSISCEVGLHSSRARSDSEGPQSAEIYVAAEEKSERSADNHRFNFAGAIILLLVATVYPAFWVLWKALTGGELPGKPIFSVQNLVATPVMLFAAVLVLRLYKRKSLLASVDSRAFDIRARALKSLESGWIDLYFEPSIEGKEPMCLPLRFAPSQVLHPGMQDVSSILKDRDTELPLGTSINKVFEQSGRSLLVLGEPGSGKTTLLLQLSKYLHSLASEDPAQPIPIFLRLASWNRWWGLLSGQRAFERWLIRQMKLSYFISKDLGRNWLRTGKVVLILDGLDEVVTPKARRSCRNAIHELASRLQGGMAVACRTEEYVILDQLPMNFAIEALPVTEPQVLQYIATIPSARRLSLALKADPAAIKVLTTPFALTLALAAYSSRSKLRWPSAGRFSISRLLNDFVETKMSIQLENSRYRKESFLRWMRNLAQCGKLGKQTVFDPVELRERWFSSTWIHATCKGLVVLAVMTFCVFFEQMLWSFDLTIGQKCGLNGSPVAHCVTMAFHPGYARIIWNMVPGILIVAGLQGIIAACVIGLPVGIFGSLFQLRPVKLASSGFFPSRVRQSLQMLVGASAGICAALVPIGLVLRGFFRHDLQPNFWNWSTNPLSQLKGPLYAQVGYLLGNALTIKAAAIFSLCAGFVLALAVFLSAEGNSNLKLSSAIRTSVSIALLFGAVVGTILWWCEPKMRMEYVMMLGANGMEKEDIPFGGALLIVLAAGGLFTIRHYVTRLVMVVTRYGPWDYSRFLDLATECGFLRPVSGPDRIFRHPMLRDYFANLSSREES